MVEVSLPIFIAIWTVVAVIVVGTLVLIVRAVKKRSRPGLDGEYIERRMSTIEKLVEGSSDTEYAMALVEADKLLDHILKMRHIPGTTLGERLKAAGYTYPNLRDIWPAHLLRNRLVHEHNVTITKSQINKIWKQYKSAYRILSR